LCRVVPGAGAHTRANENARSNRNLKEATVSTDYAPLHPNPTPDSPPPSVNVHADYAPLHPNPTPDSPPSVVIVHSDYAPAQHKPPISYHEYALEYRTPPVYSDYAPLHPDPGTPDDHFYPPGYGA
jgi:hypothetical protein